MTFSRMTPSLLAAILVVALASREPAQRPNNQNPNQAKPDANAPTATGKVVAYEADKSITLEVGGGRTEAKKVEFALVKDKTKIELPPRVKDKGIQAGMVLAVWADKDNPRQAARIAVPAAGPGGGVRPPAPR
jgi:hypothetical protein